MIMHIRRIESLLSLFIICFTLFQTHGFCGKDDPYKAVDQIAKTVPDSMEASVSSLSGFFLEKVSGNRNLLRAFYVWCASEISYDTESMYNPKPMENRGKLILETLEKRKAVCQGYAEVFHELCNLAGIENYLIQGYTRQNGTIMPLSHTWVLARPDTSWLFLDPTWGSGYVMNEQFTHKFNPAFFLVPPEKMIESHMPFDPMWQCLRFPYSSSDFYNAEAPDPGSSVPFAFSDTIAAYNQLPETEKKIVSLRRTEANGVVNNNIGEYIRYLRQNIEAERINQENTLKNELVNQFNVAVKYHNSASLLFNNYINFFNKQFRPPVPDSELRQMLDTCKVNLNLGLELLSKIKPREESLEQNKASLLRSFNLLNQQVEKQSAFLREYLGTPKQQRSSLFQKYKF